MTLYQIVSLWCSWLGYDLWNLIVRIPFSKLAITFSGYSKERWITKPMCDIITTIQTLLLARRGIVLENFPCCFLDIAYLSLSGASEKVLCPHIVRWFYYMLMLTFSFFSLGSLNVAVILFPSLTSCKSILNGMSRGVTKMYENLNSEMHTWSSGWFLLMSYIIIWVGCMSIPSTIEAVVKIQDGKEDQWMCTAVMLHHVNNGLLVLVRTEGMTAMHVQLLVSWSFWLCSRSLILFAGSNRQPDCQLFSITWWCGSAMQNWYKFERVYQCCIVTSDWKWLGV